MNGPHAIFTANIGDSSAEKGRVPAWRVEDVNSNCGDYGTDGVDRYSKGTVAERMHAHEIRLPMALTAEAQQRF